MKQQQKQIKPFRGNSFYERVTSNLIRSIPQKPKRG